MKQRKKQNRFNGLTEEELSKRLLPDLLVPDLDILIVRFLGFLFFFRIVRFVVRFFLIVRFLYFLFFLLKDLLLNIFFVRFVVV